MRTRIAADLVIPLLASAYAIYMIHEQLTGSYRQSTVTYALVIGGAVILLGVLAIIQTLRSASVGDDVRPSAPVEHRRLGKHGRGEHLIRGLSVFGLVCILVYFFDFLGYAVGFFLFCAAALVILKVRSPLTLIAVPLCTVLIIHFLFVGWFHLSLPAGMLSGIL